MRPRDRVTVLAGAMPEVESLRAALRPWCDGRVALDRLELSHVTVGPRGPVRLLLEAGERPDPAHLPIGRDDINAVIAQFLTSYYIGQETNAAQTAELAQYELIGGGWRNSLAFLEKSGRNLTPDKLPAREVAQLYAACDQHLRRVIEALQPEWLIGVGDFAERRAKFLFGNSAVKLGKILHPSPASPAANKDWAGQATRQLQDFGVWESK